MPVKGNEVLPSAETPDHPVDASALLTPDDVGIPQKSRYYLSELAPYLCKEVPGDVEAQSRARESTLRALERLCADGKIRGLRVGRNIMLPRSELLRVFVAINTLVSEN